MLGRRSGMSRKLRIAYLLHSLRSDWNNGNAHFLRGLARSLVRLGHEVTIYEPEAEWSIDNLRLEGTKGETSLRRFAATYPDLTISPYSPDLKSLTASLHGADILIVHEWNSPELIDHILSLRQTLGFRTLFHDTHHRASSSPEALRRLQIPRFDGVLAFGEALRKIYLKDFGLHRVWTLHEAADISVFHPREGAAKQQDVVWIGNWGDDERSEEIRQYLLRPASRLPQHRFLIYGVRYPADALAALSKARVCYGGYLANLDAPAAYAASRLTVHIPRQQYTGAMAGIPTIRVFEALASGIPLISAPWQDTEGLFRPGDFVFARSEDEMVAAMEQLLENPVLAQKQASRGLETVLAHHTCDHRAQQLTGIFEEVLAR